MTRWLRGGEIYIRSKEDELLKTRGGIEIWGGLALFFGLTFVAGAAYPAAQDFFNGKTVRIVVGVTAGGGFDAYARAIARHIGRHIPGNPTFIVENMPGAGSLIAANQVYRVAKPDGLTMGHFLGGLFLQQLFGSPGIEFDARRFGYVGAPLTDNPVCVLAKATGIDTAEKWLASKSTVKMAGNAPGTIADDIPKILRASLGLPARVVSGYKGASEMRLAVESGEADGICQGWDSLKSTWRSRVESKDVNVVLQVLPKPHPDLPNVSLAISYARTDEARQLIEAGIHAVSASYRPFVLPPGTPKDRVQILRKAFMETMIDKDFLEEARKSKLDLNPLNGEELERTVTDLLALKPSMVEKLKEILK
jgi:tripartite-type tricarboxylate transporter receptor subunit TctC